MSVRIELMETSIELSGRRDLKSRETLIERLKHKDWRVRYAAAIALENFPAPESVDALIGVLKAEDASPIYGQDSKVGDSIHAGSNQKANMDFIRDVDDETLEAWRRRGRIKQAVCLTLGRIGREAEPSLPWLHRYAVGQKEDYSVRAAACKALGMIGNHSSMKILEQASNDQEWCTKTEAAKSLAAIKF